MKRSDQYQELRELTDAVIDKQATEAQIVRLKTLLANDPKAQNFYFDYVAVHTRLKASAANNIEFVYRRMTEEEIIMRPMGQTRDDFNLGSNDRSPLEHDVSPSEESSVEAPKQPKNGERKLKWRFILLLLFAIVAALFIVFNERDEPEHFYAILQGGEVSTGEFGQIKDGHLLAGEYHIKQKSLIGLKTGETLNLAENSVITIFNNNKVELKKGALSIVPVPNNSIEVAADNFTLYSNGGALSLDLRNDNPIIKSSKQTLFSPHRWRPTHYWSFDGRSDRALDMAGNADGVVYPGVTRVQGLVGQGAFLFDNSKNARLNLGNGGGSVLASGSFSAMEGITIEAVINTDYSGIVDDEDHIFRKGGTDGQFRILLSFQNDKRPKSYLRPEGKFKESLSFGLFVLGQGYHELKLALDGMDGRPTLSDLKDGNYHHIVATYDVSTGLKAIYIDGKLLAFYQYPPGSKLVSGGRGDANIGNATNYPISHTQPISAAFTGVIDEVAFYAFSLPALMVQNHYEQIQMGYNYFGLPPSATSLPEQIKLPLPPFKTIELEPRSGLLYRIVPETQ